ncbi:hypothetical protein [Mameliella alba]|uniref:hypothetical protein n=1 Tax=Mameliella alba TaxID=561184 RepID=UPI001431D8DC|nr:hypothetical protein [Mameliella alba]
MALVGDDQLGFHQLQTLLDELFLLELMELKLNGFTSTSGGHVLIQQGLALPWLHVSHGGLLDGRSFLALELTVAGHHEFDERMAGLPGTRASNLLRDAVLNYQRDEVPDGVCASSKRIDAAGDECDFPFLRQLCDAETGTRHFTEADISTLASSCQLGPAANLSSPKRPNTGLVPQEISAQSDDRTFGSITRARSWLHLTLSEEPKPGLWDWLERNVDAVIAQVIRDYEADLFLADLTEDYDADEEDDVPGKPMACDQTKPPDSAG